MLDPINEKLDQIFGSIEYALDRDDLPHIDNMLKNLDENATSLRVQIAHLRGSFRVKDLLTEWNNCLQRCFNRDLQERGDKAHRTFIGLVKRPQ